MIKTTVFCVPEVYDYLNTYHSTDCVKILQDAFC